MPEFLKKIPIQELNIYFDERNKNLTFQGKNFLQFCISEIIVNKYQNLSTKQMNSILKLYSSNAHMTNIARGLGFDYFFLNYELQDVEEREKRNNYISSALLRIIGHLYEYKGLIPAYEFIQNFIFKDIDVTNILISFHPVQELTHLCEEKEINLRLEEKSKNGRHFCTIYMNDEKMIEYEALTLKIAKEKACNEVLLNYYSKTFNDLSTLEKYVDENKYQF